MKIPLGTLLTKHVRVTVLGTFIMLATYTLFYIMTVYSMTFSTAAAPVGLGLPRNEDEPEYLPAPASAFYRLPDEYSPQCCRPPCQISAVAGAGQHF